MTTYSSIAGEWIGFENKETLAHRCDYINSKGDYFNTYSDA